MRKVILSSVFAALFVLSGCSDKEPQVEAVDNAAAIPAAKIDLIFMCNPLYSLFK